MEKWVVSVAHQVHRGHTVWWEVWYQTKNEYALCQRELFKMPRHIKLSFCELSYFTRRTENFFQASGLNPKENLRGELNSGENWELCMMTLDELSKIPFSSYDAWSNSCRFNILLMDKSIFLQICYQKLILILSNCNLLKQWRGLQSAKVVRSLILLCSPLYLVINGCLSYLSNLYFANRKSNRCGSFMLLDNKKWTYCFYFTCLTCSCRVVAPAGNRELRKVKVYQEARRSF